jgi:hypothetical protein
MDIKDTESSKCSECAKRNVFGYREQDTFDSCDCVIDIKDATWKFLKFCGYHNLLLMIKDSDSCPPIDGLINRLKLLTHSQLIDAFYPIKRFGELANKFYKTIRKYHRKWNKNDYLDVCCGNMIFTRQLAHILSTGSRGVDIYKDVSVKFISLNYVLHHVEDPYNLLKEIYRVLRPGGIFIMGEFNCLNWKDSYYLNLYHFAMNKVLNTAPSTCWYRSSSQWRSIITSFGFEYLPKETIYSSPDIYSGFYDFYEKPSGKKSRRDDISDIKKKDKEASLDS